MYYIPPSNNFDEQINIFVQDKEAARDTNI